MKFLLSLFFILSSCSSVRLQNPQREVTLLELEKVKIGKTTATELKQVLNTPTRVIQETPNEELWSYEFQESVQSVSISTFTVSKKDGTVIGAAWISNLSSAPKNKSELLSHHFKNFVFKAEAIAATDKHRLPHEVDYTDKKNGVSFRVNKANGNIVAITMGIPENVRVLAEEPKLNP